MIAAALLAGGALLAAAPAASRDWAATLRTDAQAFHDRIAADHPGPLNRLDPGFTRRNDAGLRTALARAARVRDAAGYVWAMRGYVASFDDGHVQFSTVSDATVLKGRWPGFLTGLDGQGRQVVMTRAGDAPVPLGAVLQGCDGVPAARLLAANVGAFSGRWQLLASRSTRAGRLFVDTDNPFIVRPSRCTFSVAGQRRAVTLAWRPLEDPEWARRVSETAPRATPPIGARVLADGTRWFSMSSFNGDPSGPAAQALRPMIAGMTRDRAALLAAPRIVFDLRGNGGGSSQWSHDIAVLLWGKAAVDAADANETYVEWRASADNLAAVEAYRDQWSKAADASPEALEWARRAVAGLTAARAKGQGLWRDADDAVAPAGRVAPPRLAVPVYVVTDWGCGSACLDAVDLWTALGAVAVGQETSADTLYMEVGDATLPSGLARIGVPMKVYRGRKRGSNVPVSPVDAFTGDMRDTPALEAWIATLPERRG